MEIPVNIACDYKIMKTYKPSFHDKVPTTAKLLTHNLVSSSVNFTHAPDENMTGSTFVLDISCSV